MKKAPEELRFAVMAVDIIALSIVDGELCGLVSQVNRPPHYVNCLGFLGGIIDPEETAEEASERILKEKGDISNLYLEQLYTFSEVERDKRNRVVSVGYIALIKPATAALYTHESAKFVPVKKLKDLAYDHDVMLKMALKRLEGKVAYTTIAKELLASEFTLTELQQVYEIILKRELDKRNFRKKILSLDIVEETGNMQEGAANRPAALYRFINKNVIELPAIV